MVIHCLTSFEGWQHAIFRLPSGIYNIRYVLIIDRFCILGVIIESTINCNFVGFLIFAFLIAGVGAAFAFTCAIPWSRGENGVLINALKTGW